MENKKKVLVIAPHPDDADLGCGGTLARLVESGCELFLISLTNYTTTQSGMKPTDIVLECENAMKVFGIERWELHHFTIRQFPSDRQWILEFLFKYRSFNPDLVLTSSMSDLHQDHSALPMEVMRVFHGASILSWELPGKWNHGAFKPNCFITLEKRHVDKKRQAMLCYKTQQSKDYFKRIDTYLEMTKLRGMQVGVEYAEAFEVLRWIV